MRDDQRRYFRTRRSQYGGIVQELFRETKINKTNNVFDATVSNVVELGFEQLPNQKRENKSAIELLEFLCCGLVSEYFFQH